MSEETFNGVNGNQEWRVRFEHDQDAANPREEFDNAWTLVCAHRRYTLGDHQIKDPSELGDILAREGLKEDDVLIRPIYLFDHSGLSISTSPFNDPWDSGQVGVAFISRAALQEDFGGDEAKALACLDAEMNVYDAYLSGEVYGGIYETRPAGQFEDEGEGWEEQGACWGFYGMEDALSGYAQHLPDEVAACVYPPKRAAVSQEETASPPETDPKKPSSENRRPRPGRS